MPRSQGGRWHACTQIRPSSSPLCPRLRSNVVADDAAKLAAHNTEPADRVGVMSLGIAGETEHPEPCTSAHDSAHLHQLQPLAPGHSKAVHAPCAFSTHDLSGGWMTIALRVRACLLAQAAATHTSAWITGRPRSRLTARSGSGTDLPACLQLAATAPGDTALWVELRRSHAYVRRDGCGRRHERLERAGRASLRARHAEYAGLAGGIDPGGLDARGGPTRRRRSRPPDRPRRIESSGCSGRRTRRLRRPQVGGRGPFAACRSRAPGPQADRPRRQAPSRDAMRRSCHLRLVSARPRRATPDGGRQPQ